MENQKKLWNKIAPNWNKFKDEPGIMTLRFLQRRKGKILDLGCGSGRFLIKQKDTKFYGVDFSKKMIELAKEKAKRMNIDAEFTLSKATKLPFESCFFDAAIFVATLHCIETKRKRKMALKELLRVLKPGAKAKISVWNKDSKRFKNSPKERTVGWLDLGKRYYYLYEPQELYNLVKEVGFKIFAKPEPAREIPLIVEKPK